MKQKRITVAEYLALCKKGNKYKAERITVNGETFDSKAEYSRWCELKLLERSGAISNLTRQIKFELLPPQKGERGITYTPDFVYVENGVTVAEEVKSKGTKKARDYPLRRKLFKAKYPEIIFKENVK